MSQGLTERWIEGLQFKEKRQLSPEENNELRLYINKLRKVTWAWILGYPIGFMFLGVVANSKLMQTNFFENIFMILVLFYTFLGLAILIQRSKDNFKLIKHLKKDHKNGVIERFEVIPASEELPKDNYVGGILVSNYIEVLAESKLVFRLDGQRPEKLILVNIAEVTSSADNSLKVPLREDFYGPNPNELYEYSQRHITDNEKEEIEKQIKEIRKIKAGNWLYYGFVTFLILCAVFAIIREGITALPKKYLPQLIAVSVMAFFVIREIFYKWRFSMWLKRNIEMGVMVIANKKISTNPASKPLNNIIEFLPIANIDWTIDGKPSKWRTYKEK